MGLRAVCMSVPSPSRSSLSLSPLAVSLALALAVSPLTVSPSPNLAVSPAPSPSLALYPPLRYEARDHLLVNGRTCSYGGTCEAIWGPLPLLESPKAKTQPSKGGDLQIDRYEEKRRKERAHHEQPSSMCVLSP